jgi:hypothetical protein
MAETHFKVSGGEKNEVFPLRQFDAQAEAEGTNSDAKNPLLTSMTYVEVGTILLP